MKKEKLTHTEKAHAVELANRVFSNENTRRLACKMPSVHEAAHNIRDGIITRRHYTLLYEFFEY